MIGLAAVCNYGRDLSPNVDLTCSECVSRRRVLLVASSSIDRCHVIAAGRSTCCVIQAGHSALVYLLLIGFQTDATFCDTIVSEYCTQHLSRKTIDVIRWRYWIQVITYMAIGNL